MLPGFIAIESVLAPIGDEEIGIAVVIVIAGADAFGPAGSGDSHFSGNVSETACAFVVIEARWRTVATGYEGVEESVIIVIEEGDAAAGGLDYIGLRFHAAVGDDAREAAGGGFVAELRGPGWGESSDNGGAKKQNQGGSHFGGGGFSPSFFRKSLNSPSGVLCSSSSVVFSRRASSMRPVLR